MQQMSLSFEPGLDTRYASARECLSTQVYQRGLVRIAGQLDMAPSKLTEKLAGIDSSGRTRGFTLDELEQYIERTGDTTVLMYLCAKHMRNPVARQQEALERLASLADVLPGLLTAAGLAKTKTGR